MAVNQPIRICEQCGATFTPKYQGWHLPGRGRFCSRKCSNQVVRIHPFEPHQHIASFWTKVAVRGPDDCWLWLACRTGNSKYGQFSGGALVTGHKIITAHRFSWWLHFGPVPNDMQVLHRCDVKTCVNPAHLFLGTQRDNMRDMVAKGRWGNYHDPEHCQRGHSWTPDNTIQGPDGRRCRICRQERDRRRRRGRVPLL